MLVTMSWIGRSYSTQVLKWLILSTHREYVKLVQDLTISTTFMFFSWKMDMSHEYKNPNC